MIVFAAIMPHPPVSIPGIGGKEHSEAIEKTLRSFEVLRTGLEQANPDTIIIISPHAQMEPYSFVINSASDLSGTLEKFGLDMVQSFKNDTETVNKIAYFCQTNEFEAHLHPDFLDHGTLIPLYHLTKNIRPKVVQLSFSLSSYEWHYRYGEIIGNMLEKDESKRYAVIASADLSHRLTLEAPAGYSAGARNFDSEIIRHLVNNDILSIMKMQQKTAQEAAECGIRSIIILLGILHGKKYSFELLSYEGPFGIGHMTARLM
jgi:MEMO1 family protein